MRQYDTDRDEVIQRALNAGVNMICVGTDLNTSKQAIALANEYDGVWASVGLHPNDNLEEVYEQAEYSELTKNPKVVAIGEVGLDYYRTTDEKKKKLQKERFEKQIELAISLQKPLIIHCRDAHNDMIEMLRDLKLSARGVIHSFTGTWTDAQRYFELGFYIGLNGIITFTDQYYETVANAPVDKLLLETDAPYLAPAPYRGKRNEPAYVIEVAGRVAAIKNIEVDKLLEQTVQNSQDLFSLNI